MTERRYELNEILCKVLGSSNVYFQPPSTLKMSYPAITYSRSNIDSQTSNNRLYSTTTRYTGTVIDKNPDSTIISKILELPYTRHDRSYPKDNLNHDVFTIYY